MGGNIVYISFNNFDNNFDEMSLFKLQNRIKTLETDVTLDEGEDQAGKHLNLFSSHYQKLTHIICPTNIKKTAS